MPRGKALFLGLCIQWFLFACSPTKFVIRQSSDVFEESKIVFTRESDLRLAEQSLSGNLKLLEVLQHQDPENEMINLFLAEAYASYALGFAEDRYEELEFAEPELRDVERQRTVFFYLRARGFALQALQNYMEIENLEELSVSDFDAKLSLLSADAVPAVFWTAFSWGSAINQNRDDISALAQLGKIEVMMNFVKKHDPEFFFGGVYLFEGVFYGSRSSMLGGDLQRSQQGFSKALSISKGRLLIVPYLKAYSYCIFSQDRECFRENLSAVIDAPADIFPEQNLANAVAKKKARRLLSREEEYFLPDFDEDEVDENEEGNL